MKSVHSIQGIDNDELTTQIIQCLISITTKGLQSLTRITTNITTEGLQNLTKMTTEGLEHLIPKPAETIDSSLGSQTTNIRKSTIESINEMENPSINEQDFLAQGPRQLFPAETSSVSPPNSVYYYPNGSTNFTLPKVAAIHGKKVIPPSFGWKFVTYNSKKMSTGFYRTYKYCLGVYQCQNCQFKESP